MAHAPFAVGKIGSGLTTRMAEDLLSAIHAVLEMDLN